MLYCNECYALSSTTFSTKKNPKILRESLLGPTRTEVELITSEYEETRETRLDKGVRNMALIDLKLSSVYRR